MSNTQIITVLTEAVTGLEASPNSKTPMYSESIDLYNGLIYLLKSGLSFTEANFVNCVIQAILEAGYSISVHDGESWCLNSCTKRAVIAEALNSTGEDTIQIRNAYNERIGWIDFIYDNGGAEYTISDYSANDQIEAIVAPLYKRFFNI